MSLSEVRAQLTARLGNHVERGLHEIEAAVAVLRDPQMGGQLHDQLIEVVDAKIEDLFGVVGECRHYLTEDPDQVRTGRYPMDAASCLERVVERRRVEAGRRKIDLELGIPDDLGQVLAAPEEMERGLEAILEFLLDDAEEGHPLWIRVEEKGNETAFRFSNRGYGFAQERLDGILEGDGEADRRSERGLAGLRGRVELWGGSLVGSSDIGVGTQLELTLHRLRHV